MTREEATDEARLWIVNTEPLYRATHDAEGRYRMRTPIELRCAVGDSIPGLHATAVDWTELHAELVAGND
jgi:hypothetical protein